MTSPRRRFVKERKFLKKQISRASSVSNYCFTEGANIGIIASVGDERQLMERFPRLTIKEIRRRLGLYSKNLLQMSHEEKEKISALQKKLANLKQRRRSTRKKR